MYTPFQKRIITKQLNNTMFKEGTVFLVVRLPNSWVRSQLGRMNVLVIKYGKGGKLRLEPHEVLVPLIDTNTYKDAKIQLHDCFESEEVKFEHKNIVSLSTEDFLAYITTMSLRLDTIGGNRFNYGPDILNTNVNILEVLTPKNINPGKTWVAIFRHFQGFTVKTSPLQAFFNIEVNREVVVKELQKQLVILGKGIGNRELLFQYYAIARAHDWVSAQIGPLDIEIAEYGKHSPAHFMEYFQKEINKINKGRQKK